MRKRWPVEVSTTSRSVVLDPSRASFTLDVSSFRDFKVYESKGASSTCRSCWWNVCACAPSFAGVGTAAVVPLEADGNAVGLDCFVKGSSKDSRLLRLIGFGVKFLTVRRGAIGLQEAPLKLQRRHSEPLSGDN